MRELQATVAGGIEELDSARPLHMSEEVSTRRVMREMRRFQLELNSRAPVQLEASSLRAWPKWIYPVAAAAAAIFIAPSGATSIVAPVRSIQNRPMPLATTR